MRKLYEFFKVLPFQKRIVDEATISGNTLFTTFSNLQWTNEPELTLSKKNTQRRNLTRSNPKIWCVWAALRYEEPTVV